MSNIYSIIRCRGKYANACVFRQIRSDTYGMYAIYKINDSEEDQLIYFSDKHEDFHDVVENESEFVKNLLEKMGDKTYPEGTTTGTKKVNYEFISGTIECNTLRLGDIHFEL